MNQGQSWSLRRALDVTITLPKVTSIASVKKHDLRQSLYGQIGAL
jgi:hypothetical protein